MDVLTAILLGIGLAMDAFAVSICKGLAMGKAKIKPMVIIGFWFGFFQFLMPVIGFYVGRAFYDYIEQYDHWIAFILLVLIGGNMLREAFFGEDEEEDIDDNIGFKVMLLLAIATSIDALAVGISMAMSGDTILVPALIIGVVTMAISMGGVKIGSTVGDRFGNKADILGGVILILIGVKVLLEGLGYI